MSLGKRQTETMGWMCVEGTDLVTAHAIRRTTKDLIPQKNSWERSVDDVRLGKGEIIETDKREAGQLECYK